LTFARSFAKLSRHFRENIRIHRPLTPAISRGRIEGKASTRGLGVWLSQSLTFGNLAMMMITTIDADDDTGMVHEKEEDADDDIEK